MNVADALLEKLAYDRIRHALSERAATRLGVERAEELTPLDGPEQAAELLDRTDEILAGDELPLGGIEDVRPLLRRARDGAMLEGAEILSLAYTLDGTERLRRAVAESERPALTELALRMGSFEGWLRLVRERLDGEGEVRDDATPKLHDIRRRLRPLRGRIREKMQQLLERYADAVQDPLVTLRRDRYVIPIRASAQSKVPGIAIDTSDSGRTVFIEPQPVVAMNNELALLEFEERDEVRRILLELGRRIADHPEVDDTLRTVAELDLANAAARLAHDWSLKRAEVAGDGATFLPRARHPLITGCIPNELRLDQARRLLIVTGPNAGGKTVLLKTLGVAVLMAQSGLFVAAGDEANPPRLPWFEAILADIGDEQSIEASLSTYAGHLTNLATIVRDAGPATLVLIDELGSGTDPDEGAALSQAILEEVLRSGARGLVTTHLAPLKVFASDAEGVRNAAMRFDVDRLQPTFELHVGQPGRSYALAIAERLGLGDEVLARAAEVLGPEGERLERLLSTLELQREELAAAQAEAERRSEEARDEAELLRDQIERLRSREELLMAEAAARAESELQATLQRAAKLGRSARTEEGEGRSQALEEIRRLRQEAREQARPEPAPSAGAAAEQAGPSVGSRVRVPSYDAEGRLLELRGERALVQLGLIKLEVGLHEIEPLADEADVTAASGQARPGARATTFASGVPDELNIRGERVEQALEKVRDFVLEAHAMKAGKVRILHGKGTGALRDAVRSYLKNEKKVERFEDAVPYEGGHGVTVAYLRG